MYRFVAVILEDYVSGYRRWYPTLHPADTFELPSPSFTNAFHPDISGDRDDSSGDE